MDIQQVEAGVRKRIAFPSVGLTHQLRGAVLYSSESYADLKWADDAEACVDICFKGKELLSNHVSVKVTSLDHMSVNRMVLFQWPPLPISPWQSEDIFYSTCFVRILQKEAVWKESYA